MTIRLRVCVIAAGLLLVGCQSGPGPLAQENASLPPACSWPRRPAAETQAWVRAGVAELEAHGYTIRNTDLTLGVVSAERTTSKPGLGAVDDPWFRGSSLWGSFGRRSAVGFGIGIDFDDDPVQIERVSLVIGDETLKMTRDSSVVDDDGFVIDARAYNRDSFCREISGAMESRLLNAQSSP